MARATPSNKGLLSSGFGDMKIDADEPYDVLDKGLEFAGEAKLMDLQ